MTAMLVCILGGSLSRVSRAHMWRHQNQEIKRSEYQPLLREASAGAGLEAGPGGVSLLGPCVEGHPRASAPAMPLGTGWGAEHSVVCGLRCVGAGAHPH